MHSPSLVLPSVANKSILNSVMHQHQFLQLLKFNYSLSSHKILMSHKVYFAHWQGYPTSSCVGWFSHFKIFANIQFHAKMLRIHFFVCNKSRVLKMYCKVWSYPVEWTFSNAFFFLVFQSPRLLECLGFTRNALLVLRNTSVVINLGPPSRKTFF